MTTTHTTSATQLPSVVQERQRRAKLRRNMFYLVLLAMGLVAPFVAYPVFLMKILCFALFACAFNLLLGYAGLLSFGHAAFLATGGYVTGYLLASYPGLTPELGILAGTLMATLLGVLFGVLSIRRQGIYFAMVTLALAQLMFFVFVQSSFTGGEDGLHGVPRGHLFGVIDLSSNLAMYYFVFAVFVFGFAVIQRTVHSPFGQVLKAIRENEPRAVSLGYNVDAYKLLAFVLSAALAGLAGSTKTVVFQLASLTDAHWHMSGEVILMTLLGGVGTLLGPLMGAGLVVSLQHLLAQSPLGNWVSVILGIIFVVCVLSFRSGIIGELAKMYRKNFK
ncbi:MULTISPECIES: branched-chain amino acid ABC transporter permease [Halomonadaceae]|jgi:branched-chain amino acid transport system permease protein|uniref:Amino acid/amide ABC transporter membrane protein 2, HAAT family n=1 Tax=Vreelandella aquamarina TaxID=77097 RepID=A0A1N6GH80_9GAMM|nr:MULTISPECIES: branched-chain amino acid ABC transporter permease [Halomonas]KTG25470.1 ABC transporter permease [Idiomarina sp. H105]MEC8901666.1 branched-chain amino acid ABC transporter permease [Pseudomonadota bacterium]OAE96096.1 ABC transporter permease [Idiomarina sp. WRN-38]MAM03367.1 branched-chain amino acid ABC transporter permease [Halomonas sp.]MCC4286857.1 branched-chain amino acid ABC transporter permease [Halomonas meridiana]|tara:strand:- start:492 stop:1493 length:1002 start_codon:yes stop_codon:yes gene_type:complete